MPGPAALLPKIPPAAGLAAFPNIPVVGVDAVLLAAGAEDVFPRPPKLNVLPTGDAAGAAPNMLGEDVPDVAAGFAPPNSPPDAGAAFPNMLGVAAPDAVDGFAPNRPCPPADAPPPNKFGAAGLLAPPPKRPVPVALTGAAADCPEGVAVPGAVVPLPKRPLELVCAGFEDCPNRLLLPLPPVPPKLKAIMKEAPGVVCRGAGWSSSWNLRALLEACLEVDVERCAPRIEQ